jgi:hypothetical protein
MNIPGIYQVRLCYMYVIHHFSNNVGRFSQALREHLWSAFRPTQPQATGQTGQPSNGPKR